MCPWRTASSPALRSQCIAGRLWRGHRPPEAQWLVCPRTACTWPGSASRSGESVDHASYGELGQDLKKRKEHSHGFPTESVRRWHPSPLLRDALHGPSPSSSQGRQAGRFRDAEQEGIGPEHIRLTHEAIHHRQRVRMTVALAEGDLGCPRSEMLGSRLEDASGTDTPTSTGGTVAASYTFTSTGVYEECLDAAADFWGRIGRHQLQDGRLLSPLGQGGAEHCPSRVLPLLEPLPGRSAAAGKMTAHGCYQLRELCCPIDIILVFVAVNPFVIPPTGLVDWLSPQHV